jgi:hypothetical protein
VGEGIGGQERHPEGAGHVGFELCAPAVLPAGKEGHGFAAQEVFQVDAEVIRPGVLAIQGVDFGGIGDGVTERAQGRCGGIEGGIIVFGESGHWTGEIKYHMGLLECRCLLAAGKAEDAEPSRAWLLRLPGLGDGHAAHGLQRGARANVDRGRVDDVNVTVARIGVADIPERRMARFWRRCSGMNTRAWWCLERLFLAVAWAMWATGRLLCVGIALVYRVVYRPRC